MSGSIANEKVCTPAVSGVMVTLGSYYFSMRVIDPFVPFMVHSFYPHQSKTELGYYTGFVDAAFYLGNAIFSLQWSRISDHFGRRPAILGGLTGAAVLSLAFGCSVDFWMMIATRFVWGGLDGIISVVKTVMGEIATPRTHARLYSSIGVFGGLGRLGGNIVGGFLAGVQLPAKGLHQFKYLVPCIVSAGIILVAITLIALFLPETRDLRRESVKAPLDGDKGSGAVTVVKDSDDFVAPLTGGGQPTRNGHSDQDELGSDSDTDSEESDDPTKEIQLMESLPISAPTSRGSSRQDMEPSQTVSRTQGGAAAIGPEQSMLLSVRQEAAANEPYSVSARGNGAMYPTVLATPAVRHTVQGGSGGTTGKRTKRTTLARLRKKTRAAMKVLKIRAVWVTAGYYTGVSFLGAALTAVVPLWLVQHKHDGGFDFRPADIGLVFAIVGPIYTVMQMFVFPLLVKAIGYVLFGKILGIIYGCFIILLPHLSMAKNEHYAVRIVVLAIGLGIPFTAAVMSMSVVNALINHSVPKRKRAVANGIAQTFGAFARATAPIIVCVMFSAIVTLDMKWPVNYVLPFYLQAIVAWCMVAWLHFLLPEMHDEMLQRKK